MPTEKQLQLYFRRKAKAEGIVFHKLESRSARGFPDVGVFYKGQFILIELKSPKGTGRLSQSQIKEISKLREQGMDVRIVQSKAEVDDVIAQLINSLYVT